MSLACLGATYAAEVVGNARQHASLEDAQNEANGANRVDVVDKGRRNGNGAKAQRDDGDEPSRTDPLAADIRRNLKEDVRDVEDGQDLVVVVTFEVEILLQTCQACIADVGSVDEAEAGSAIRGTVLAAMWISVETTHR